MVVHSTIDCRLPGELYFFTSKLRAVMCIHLLSRSLDVFTHVCAGVLYRFNILSNIYIQQPRSRLLARGIFVRDQSGTSHSRSEDLREGCRRHKSPTALFHRTGEYRARWHGPRGGYPFFPSFSRSLAINPSFVPLLLRSLARSLAARPITSLKFLMSLR